MFYFDYTYLVFIVPALILSMLAQMKVQSAFDKYSRIKNRNLIEADDVARKLLNDAGSVAMFLNSFLILMICALSLYKEKKAFLFFVNVYQFYYFFPHQQ